MALITHSRKVDVMKQRNSLLSGAAGPVDDLVTTRFNFNWPHDALYPQN
jgi:hypothetical protein